MLANWEESVTHRLARGKNGVLDYEDVEVGAGGQGGEKAVRRGPHFSQGGVAS